MKLKRSFFITFAITYIIISYLSEMFVGIKWNASASLFARFLGFTKMALTDWALIKICISLVCATIANFL